MFQDLNFIPIPKATQIVAVAISDDIVENKETKIPAEDGMPFAGAVFNMVEDCFEIDCVDFCVIGSIPFSFKMTMQNVLAWKVNVPLPTEMIYDKLTDQQKVCLKDFSDKYSHCKIQFLQMVKS